MTKTMEGALARAVECVRRNTEGLEGPFDVQHVCEWAIGAAFRYVRNEPEPKIIDIDHRPGNIHEKGPTALGGSREQLAAASRQMGFTGLVCESCGNFTLVQNGTCFKCMTCGSTTGCS